MDELVLVVEDDPVLARTFGRALRRDGLRVKLVETGEEALTLYGKEAPSIVIVDLGLPDMSGMDVAMMMRAIDESVPIIICTGQPTVASAVAAVDYNLFGYLMKPVEINAIRKMVFRAIEMTKKGYSTRPPPNNPNAGKLGELEQSLCQVRFVYQPVVDQTELIVGHEALLRCDGPLVSPVELVTAAAEFGQVDELLTIGHSTIVSDITASQPYGDLFVNVDAQELMSQRLLDGPLQQLAERTILELSLPPNGFSTPEIRRANELRKAGYRFAVERVPRGTTLSQLEDITPSFVKLGRKMLHRLNRDHALQDEVANFVHHVQTRECKVIAQGVETREEADVLKSLGLQLFQGYYFAWPAPFPPRSIVAGSDDKTIVPQAYKEP